MGAALPERQREVAQALRAFLLARAVLFEEEDTRPYECDGLTAYRQVPMVVALPETDEQVDPISYAPSLAKEIEKKYGKTAVEGLQKIGFRFEDESGA